MKMSNANRSCVELARGHAYERYSLLKVVIVYAGSHPQRCRLNCATWGSRVDKPIIPIVVCYTPGTEILDSANRLGGREIMSIGSARLEEAPVGREIQDYLTVDQGWAMRPYATIVGTDAGYLTVFRPSHTRRSRGGVPNLNITAEGRPVRRQIIHMPGARIIDHDARGA